MNLYKLWMRRRLTKAHERWLDETIMEMGRTIVFVKGPLVEVIESFKVDDEKDTAELEYMTTELKHIDRYLERQSLYIEHATKELAIKLEKYK